jgi:NADH-ubiquinone oxidoreductase chain 2
LAISLSITIFSFIGVPPLIGFFAKQMVLSVAIDKGLLLLSFIAILTSVIGAIYYLNIIKEMFFNVSNYEYNNLLSSLTLTEEKNNFHTKYQYFRNCYSISSPISFIISNITLMILLFIFINKE